MKLQKSDVEVASTLAFAAARAKADAIVRSMLMVVANIQVRGQEINDYIAAELHVGHVCTSRGIRCSAIKARQVLGRSVPYCEDRPC